MPEQITVTRHFDASPQRVFEAWSEPGHFARWFGTEEVEVPRETLDWKAEPGRPWSAVMQLPGGGGTIDWAGRFVEVDAPQRLALTITDQPDEPRQALLTIDLVAAGGGTAMTMTQETPGFSDDDIVQLEAGYAGFFDVIDRIVTE